ncbi:N-acetylmuramate alpha-1-phosphate uridylyltransferase MurU [Leeia aquatica]|uniref:Nucleotidyltransferase family protein n=1 Tax=Leeia aquatica TaxID=2725557 RepID=A0A847SH61_9NEIS|nr:nucleotidyltransferase family protein [Leeia aquatica]NLR76519.1 nucleotidyltransferase family protein [Leeia aquatica]
MILAAGRGERMRPLTDHTPKPLLQVGREPLIGWHLRHLAAAGIREVVINLAHLGAQIEAALGEGAVYGVRIRYSHEGTALETAGGIATALPLLGEQPFLLLNGDVLTDIHLPALLQRAQAQLAQRLAWLVMVPNPPHHPSGDFSLVDGLLGRAEVNRHTYAGIGVYHPAMFRDTPPHQVAKLAPLLHAAADAGQLGGEVHTGQWLDVGTPERLEAARDWVAQVGW